MIKNAEILKKLENSFMKESGILPYSQAMKIFESLWNEAVALGVLPSKNPLEGIEVDIKVAKILNSCSKNSSQKNLCLLFCPLPRPPVDRYKNPKRK